MDTQEELEKLRVLNKHLAKLLVHAENDLAYAIGKAAGRARMAEAERDDALNKLQQSERQGFQQAIQLVAELRDNDFLSGDKAAMITLDLVNDKLLEKLTQLRNT